MISKIKSIIQNKNKDVFIGIIDEDGVGKSKFDDECSLMFSFIAYIKNGGVIQEEEAVIHQVIPNIEFEIDGLNPLTIVKLVGKEIDFPNQNRIELISVVETNIRHPLLDEIILKRAEPIEYESTSLGLFILDKMSNNFETEIDWFDRKISLSMSGDMDLKELEKSAENIVVDRLNWDRRFKDKISEVLLELKNSSWLDEDEIPLTEKEFKERIKISSIVLFSKDEFEVWYLDDDIFFGHAIRISGNINGDLDNPGLCG